jgi:hypothetical protein
MSRPSPNFLSEQVSELYAVIERNIIPKLSECQLKELQLITDKMLESATQSGEDGRLLALVKVHSAVTKRLSHIVKELDGPK